MSTDRSRMTARVIPLNSREAGDPRMSGSVNELVAAVALLSAEAWRLAGKPLPQYTRTTMPVVIMSLRQSADES